MEQDVVSSFRTGQGRELELYFCGRSVTQPLHSYGPAVRSMYLLHYIVRGRGFFQTGGRRYALCAGQGFLIVPDILTYYQADGEEPWEYLWVGFGGSAAREYLEALGLSHERPVFSTDQGERLCALAEEMRRDTRDGVGGSLARNGRLSCFLSLLQREREDPAEPGARENAYVERALDFIRNHYDESIRIEEIAEHVNIDRSYLFALFRKHLGMSPKAYLTVCRMSRARQLLTDTPYSVEQIGASCGYPDPAVFSKIFKKQVGVSPSGYRRAGGAQK